MHLECEESKINCDFLLYTFYFISTNEQFQCGVFPSISFLLKILILYYSSTIFDRFLSIFWELKLAISMWIITLHILFCAKKCGPALACDMPNQGSDIWSSPGPSSGSRIFQISFPVPVPNPVNIEWLFHWSF